MAFITLEDLYGSVEVIVFPKDYEKYSNYLMEDKKIFVEGRASVEEDKDGKLILERLVSFDDIPRKLWIQFADKAAYDARAGELEALIGATEGKDHVIVYLEKERAGKDLAPQYTILANHELILSLSEAFGAENVKLT